MESPSPKAPSRDWFIPAVVGVTLLALVLRVLFIGSESLWNDELSTIIFTAHGPIEAVRAAATDTGPPLYYILQSVLNLVVPPSEWSLRIISAIAGAVSVGALALVGRRMFNATAGIVAAVMAAVSFRLIEFGQQGRAYSLGVMCVVLAALVLLRLIEKPRSLDFVLYALACAAAAYTHLFAAIAVAGMAFGVLARPTLVRRLGWPWFAAIGAALLAWVPWAFVLVRQAGRVAAQSNAGQWVLSPPDNIPYQAYYAFRQYVPWGSTNAIVVLAFIALVVLGLVPSFWVLKRGAEGEAGLGWLDRSAILIGWLALPILGGLLVSKFVVPIYDWRMAVMASPAMYLAAGYGLWRIWRPAAAVIAGVLILYMLVQLPRYYTQPVNEQWREATQLLLERNARADGVFAYAGFTMKNMDEYARILGDPQGMSGIRLVRAKMPEALLFRVEDDHAAKDGSFWLVESHIPFVRDSLTDLDVALQKAGWKVAEERVLQGVVVRHYTKSGKIVPSGASQ